MRSRLSMLRVALEMIWWYLRVPKRLPSLRVFRLYWYRILYGRYDVQDKIRAYWIRQHGAKSMWMCRA